ncbi:hypothetical protein ASE33_01215 [Pseudomonas sp. Root9]|nr:hypothetical protein ASE33_01215 [Pseudomonas sp. Root9]
MCNEHVLEHLDLCQQLAPQITEQIVIQPIHLRHLAACPQTTVDQPFAGMAVCQLIKVLLNHRYRRQASSHISSAFS